jgi:flagellar FliL protein
MADKPAKESKEEAKDGADASADGAEGKKAGKGKLFIVLAVVLVLLGGGGAGAFFMLRKPTAPEGGAAVVEHKKPTANGIVNFEPFIVNLADSGKRRFLRINVRLLVAEAEEAEHIQKSEVLQMRLRSDILELLTEQTSETIVSADGKAELKKKIAERAHHILETTEVADVLFSDFVVQY